MVTKRFLESYPTSGPQSRNWIPQIVKLFAGLSPIYAVGSVDSNFIAAFSIALVPHDRAALKLRDLRILIQLVVRAIQGSFCLQKTST